MPPPPPPRWQRFRTVLDTRSHTTQPQAFCTNPPVSFTEFGNRQARVRTQLNFLQSAAGRRSVRRSNRAPAQQEADKETHRDLSDVADSVRATLNELHSQFPDEEAWSEADKADMLSSVDPVHEGFIKSFQASLTDRLLELHKKVKELVQNPTSERSENAVVRRL